MPQDGEYKVKLGSSFMDSSDVSFMTMRYDFMPASVDKSQSGSIKVFEGKEVNVSLPNTASAGHGSTIFRGSARPVQKECILIFNKKTGEMTLERVNHSVQLKQSREIKQPEDMNETGLNSNFVSTSTNSKSTLVNARSMRPSRMSESSSDEQEVDSKSKHNLSIAFYGHNQLKTSLSSSNQPHSSASSFQTVHQHQLSYQSMSNKSSNDSISYGQKRGRNLSSSSSDNGSDSNMDSIGIQGKAPSVSFEKIADACTSANSNAILLEGKSIIDKTAPLPYLDSDTASPSDGCSSDTDGDFIETVGTSSSLIRCNPHSSDAVSSRNIIEHDLKLSDSDTDLD